MSYLFEVLVNRVKDWADNSTSKYLLRVVRIVLISIIVALLFHVIYIQTTEREVMRLDALHDNETQSELFEELVSPYQSLMIAAAENIVKYASNQSTVEIANVLYQYEKVDYFSRVVYIDLDGQIFFSNGQTLSYMDPAKLNMLSRLDYSRGARLILDKDVNGNTFPSVVAPVTSILGTIRGYVLGKVSWNEEAIVDRLDSELNSDDIFLIVNPMGEVLLQSNGTINGYDYSDLRNFNVFFNGFDLYGDVPNFAALTSKSKNGYLLQGSRQGAVYIYYNTVEKANDNMYFITIQPRANFLRVVKSIEPSERSLIIMDITLMVVLAIILAILIYRGEIRLDNVAYRDTITEARSKTYMRHQAAKLLKSEDKDKDKRMLIVVDLVGFRHINELYGRERGDEVLRVMADKLLENMGKKEILARNTADLFEMYVYYQSDWKRRLSAISSDLRSFARSIDIAVPIRIRAGAVRVTENDNDFSLLLDKANSARKNMISESEEIMVMYNNQLAEEMVLREEIEASQESALAHNEFKLYLQPKFNLQTGKISGAEALVRWIKRDGSMVFPDKFIPVFEQNSFIEKIDFHMLEMSLALQKRLVDEGINPVPISVNQSRILMLRPGYVDRVKELYNSYSFPHSLVEIEITETVFAEDKETIINVMKELHEEGCVIDMDDFGSGYSSLNTLREMPFDILKIDREFFGGSATNTGRKILRHVVEMAKDLGMKTVCEGVETEEDQDLLREMGCDYGQGYLYSKPIPAEEFLKKYIYSE